VKRLVSFFCMSRICNKALGIDVLCIDIGSLTPIIFRHLKPILVKAACGEQKKQNRYCFAYSKTQRNKLANLIYTLPGDDLSYLEGLMVVACQYKGGGEGWAKTSDLGLRYIPHESLFILLHPLTKTSTWLNWSNRPTTALRLLKEL
jgi:hypothetical protein